MGVEHFGALGAQATPVGLISRADAQDQQVIAALSGADLYYFSGGNPEHLIETLRDHGNNKTATAKTLGITREGLHKKLKQLGIG